MTETQKKAIVFLLVNFLALVSILCGTLVSLLLVGSFILWNGVLLTLPMQIYAILFRSVLVLALILTIFGIWTIEKWY